MSMSACRSGGIQVGVGRTGEYGQLAQEQQYAAQQTQDESNGETFGKVLDVRGGPDMCQWCLLTMRRSHKGESFLITRET